ncbi:uncharacterized protein LOC62_04G006492 [Vanrija pseudolonga]|uniref:Uncharacterized protein n=1 Tax=Vanrija pseudolonga TaxID=143232 RepID=A0AAF0YBN1_9TREE|nr:hypothetical protein LOC62_04G006492 [Vanrija pseudolonga]
MCVRLSDPPEPVGLGAHFDLDTDQHDRIRLLRGRIDPHPLRQPKSDCRPERLLRERWAGGPELNRFVVDGWGIGAVDLVVSFALGLIFCSERIRDDLATQRKSLGAEPMLKPMTFGGLILVVVASWLV